MRESGVRGAAPTGIPLPGQRAGSRGAALAGSQGAEPLEKNYFI